MKKGIFSFLIFVFINLFLFPGISNATVVGAGDIVRVDFDLSAQSPAPPYEGIYTSLAFGLTDYLNMNEGFSLGVFDDGGQGLTDGTGYFLLYDIVGTFDLIGAWAAGVNYSSGYVSTPDIAGIISFPTELPDLGDSLAPLFTYQAPYESIAWFGHDRILLTQTPVPEPATMLLLGSGLIGLVGFRRRLRKK